jgi:D-amino-acid dehydrogenase
VPEGVPGRFLIVGGGLIGVTTLYELASRGHSALLFEAAEELATGASFANGAMLTPSMPDPWNAPGVWRHLVASLVDPSSAMKLHWSQLPSLALWGARFLAGSSRSRHDAATLRNFELCLSSLERTRQLARELGLEFDQAERGTIKIFESEDAMAGPLGLANRLSGFGLEFEHVDAAGAVAIEPQLGPIRHRIAGALHFPRDGIGDARRFVLALADKARALGGRIETGTTIHGFIREGNKVIGLRSNDRDYRGDVILCAGVSTPRLARTAGVHVSVKPAKGYSLTVDARSLGNRMPRVAVIDDAMHAAVVPLGERLRFVGTAEFAGFDHSIKQVRIDNLITLFRRVYPELQAQLDLSAASAWAGLRPMSADGQPIIGATSKQGLWINCGHGHLGWTMACGSAQRLADAIEDRLQR